MVETFYYTSLHDISLAGYDHPTNMHKNVHRKAGMHHSLQASMCGTSIRMRKFRTTMLNNFWMPQKVTVIRGIAYTKTGMNGTRRHKRLCHLASFVPVFVRAIPCIIRYLQAQTALLCQNHVHPEPWVYSLSLHLGQMCINRGTSFSRCRKIERKGKDFSVTIDHYSIF